MTATVALWWVRRDLRLADNQALAAACAGASAVVPVFVVDPAIVGTGWAGRHRLAFLFEGLRQLDHDLRARGSYLVVRVGEPAEVLGRLVGETGARAVHAEADVSPFARRRDARVARSVPLDLEPGLTVRPAGSVVKANGEPYVVFTPYRRAWQARNPPRRADLLPAPARLGTPAGIAGEAWGDALPGLGISVGVGAGREFELWPAEPPPVGPSGERADPADAHLGPGASVSAGMGRSLDLGASVSAGMGRSLDRQGVEQGPVGPSGERADPVDALSPVTSFVAGEAAAARRLEAFTAGDRPPVYAYTEGRDRPDLDGTSGLSPYLRLGMVSARTVAVAAGEAHERAPDAGARRSAEAWLSELVWREFYVDVLHHFPRARWASFRPDLQSIAWLDDVAAYEAWCAGATGYPIVDAGMRQLVASGWMPNRVRMIAASFLVKDLLVDWRLGERFFLHYLVDGDPAANNGGWQWVAGTGTDAAPYFRVFNPASQGARHDPHGRYVRRWLPELADVPDRFVHRPWTMPEPDQRSARCVIGRDYPAPIVDHAVARARAIDAYRAARAGS